ncbi:MAG: apolipoprotein N-acyltransferase [Planctomycetota bacterium]
MRSRTAQLAFGHALSAALLGLAFPHPGWWPLAWIALVPAAWASIQGLAQSHRAAEVGDDVARGDAETRSNADSMTPASAPLSLRARLLALCLGASVRAFAIAWLIWALWWFTRTAWVRGVSFPGWFVIAAVEGLFFAAAFAWFGWLTRKTRWPAAFLLPAAWVSVELLRVTQPFGGFGWFALGHTQGAWSIDHSEVNWALASTFAGEQAASFVVALMNGVALGFVCVLHRFRRDRRSAESSGIAFKRMAGSLNNFAIFLVPALLLPVGFSLFIVKSELSSERRVPVRVAAIQTNNMNDNSVAVTAEDEAQRWRRLLQLTLEAAEGDEPVDLMVWPESALPGPVNRAAREIEVPELQQRWGFWGSREYHAQLTAIVDRADVPIFVGGTAIEGAVERQITDDQGHTRTVRFPEGRTNSVSLYAPRQGVVMGTRSDGASVDRYDKQHLVVAGETIPLGETFPWWRKLIAETISPWGGDYTLDAGEGPVVFEVELETRNSQRETVRVATPICYEIVSPGVVREMVYGEARGLNPLAPDTKFEKRVDLLTNHTNNGWYLGDSMRRQMLQIATFRAIENRVPVVMACNTGVSAVIDPTGRIVAELPTGQEGVLIAEVGLSDATTWYGWWGRWPWWALLWAMVAWSLGLAARSTRRSPPTSGQPDEPAATSAS